MSDDVVIDIEDKEEELLLKQKKRKDKLPYRITKLLHPSELIQTVYDGTIRAHKWCELMVKDYTKQGIKAYIQMVPSGIEKGYIYVTLELDRKLIQKALRLEPDED